MVLKFSLHVKSMIMVHQKYTVREDYAYGTKIFSPCKEHDHGAPKIYC